VVDLLRMVMVIEQFKDVLRSAKSSLNAAIKFACDFRKKAHIVGVNFFSVPVVFVRADAPDCDVISAIVNRVQHLGKIVAVSVPENANFFHSSHLLPVHSVYGNSYNVGERTKANSLQVADLFLRGLGELNTCLSHFLSLLVDMSGYIIYDNRIFVKGNLSERLQGLGLEPRLVES